MKTILPLLLLFMLPYFTSIHAQTINASKALTYEEIMSLLIPGSSKKNPITKLGQETDLLVLESKKRAKENELFSEQTHLIALSRTTPLNAKDLNISKSKIQEFSEELAIVNNQINLVQTNLSVFQIIEKRFHWVGFNYNLNQVFNKIMYSDDQANTFRSLASSGLNVGSNTGSIYSDIFSGPVSYVFLRFGSIVANSTSDDSQLAMNESAIQRLSMYGGNTSISMDYPVLWVRSKRNTVNAIFSLHTKGVGDFSPLSETDNKINAAFSWGCEVFADLSDPNKNVRLMGQLIVNRYHGSQSFADNLTFKSRDFWFNQCVLGIVIKETVKISLVLPLNIKNLLRDPDDFGYKSIFQAQVL